VTVVWSSEALDDLDSLRAWIAKDSPKAAREIALAIIEAVERLPDNPHIGRPGRVPGTRELVVPHTPFIVPYRVQASVLQALRVYDGARRWPERL
jgi:toxin ParE1/3/4